MDKYKEIDIEDIKILLKKNVLTAHETDSNPYPNGFNRHDFYRDFSSDMYIDGFVMQYPHGRVIRQAQGSFYYRGENQIYKSSQPSLCRKLNEIKIEELKYIEEIVAKLRIADFLDLLLRCEHSMRFIDYNLDILYEQLAQHYGFDTKWLDITTDFEVALFFACCKYDNESKNWIPLNNDDFNKNVESNYGVIFKKDVNHPNNYLPDELQKLIILPIGFQPFMRCHMQSGYAIQMDSHMKLQDDDSFEAFKFRHSEELSNFIFEKMDSGRKIYPHEGLNLMSNEIEEIKKMKRFNRDTFDFVCKADSNYNKNEIESLLNRYNYQINETPIDYFSNQKIMEVNKAYENFDIEEKYNIRLCSRTVYTLPK